MASNARAFDEARHLIATAHSLIEQAAAADGERAASLAASAAWRLADGAALFRFALEFEDITGAGITEPTGRGATLPHLTA